MGEPGPSSLDSLRQRAEAALDRNGRSVEAETLLDRIVARAEAGSEHAVFAHRHLAELRLERHPWRAALHLRRVLEVSVHDDVPHALMGLCQALLGNYRVAVSAYRKALRIAPGTPWYHHNLGHLLDVALDEPVAAETHLAEAHRLEPQHDEILASYAHCQARLARDEEGNVDPQRLANAQRFAVAARDLAPGNEEHRRLVAWIEQGAPADFVAAKEPAVPSRGDTVQQVFEERMPQGGFGEHELERARHLWGDFLRLRSLHMRKPEVYAAAVEYAIGRIQGRSVTQSSIARRYEVSAGALSSRYREIRDALSLRPGDPRYL